jgi:hypothetical protein
VEAEERVAEGGGSFRWSEAKMLLGGFLRKRPIHYLAGQSKRGRLVELISEHGQRHRRGISARTQIRCFRELASCYSGKREMNRTLQLRRRQRG